MINQGDSVYGIYKRSLRAPTKGNALVLIAVDIGRQEHTGVGPDQSLSCPQSRSRDQHSVGGHPREVRWTVTPSEGKDSDSSDSRLSHIFYCCYKPLPLCWAFAALWNFPLFIYLLFFLFLYLIFKPIINFLLFYSFALSTFIFPLQLIFNIYKSSLSTSI